MEVLNTGRDGRSDATGTSGSESRNYLWQLANALAGILYEFVIATGQVERFHGLEKVTGYRPDEVPGTSEWWRAQIHPEDHATVDQAYDVQSPTDHVVAMYRFRHKNGQWIYLEDRSVVVRDDHGSPERLIGCTVDVTHRVRSVQRLETVLASITDGLVIISPHDEFSYINDQAARILNVSREDLLGRNVWEIYEKALGTEFEKGIKCAAATHQATHFTEFYPAPLNMWIECHCYPSDEGVSVYFQDVTDRRSVEEALRQNAQLLSALIEKIPAGVYVVDSDFTVCQANQQALETFKLVQPFVGRQFREVLQSAWGSTVASEIEAVFRHTLETGDRYVAPPFSEKRVDLDAVESYEWETQRITLPDGTFGVVCYFYDVTNRVRIEQALRDSEQRARLAAKATGVGIWEWNVVTGHIRWDEQLYRIYGLEPSGPFVTYEVWRDAVLPDDLEEQEFLLRNLILTGGTSHRQFSIRRYNDNEIRVVQSFETVRTNVEGRVEWVVGTNLDVTELFASEQALKKFTKELSDADRKKDEFIAMLAHELRNPLAPIRFGIEALQKRSGDAELVRVAAIMDRQVGQIVRLVDDLLDFSRIRQGKIHLRLQRIDLRNVVRHAVEALQPSISAARHQIFVELGNEPVEVYADPNRMVQLVGNLLSNACKYTDPYGTIRIEVVCVAGKAVIRVRDNGTGIEAADLERIFDMFEQVDPGPSPSQSGLGIGLTLVKTLTELHGGTVHAYSDGPGKGSEFVVKLPFDVQSQPDTTQVMDPKTSVRARQRRVLVVDDNEDATLMLAELLRMDGHEISVAFDGETAIELAGEFLPDFILMDIGLPKLNGYEACQRIREISHLSATKIVALTGWGQTEDRERTRSAGFDAHLVKPVEFHVLTELLAQD